MRRVVYAPAADRLIYLDEKATPEFWDTHWRATGKPAVSQQRDDVAMITARFLPAGSRILEGGCGRANKVKALADAGFDAVGVDFAEDSVRQARLNYPGLDIRRGDVRSLDFPDGSFDGCWSIGVIEHFWGGYEAILSEAHRVLKPQGILFLTAPWFSPYRRLRARADGYVRMESCDEPEDFYQFALGRAEVSARLAHHGFELLRWRGLAAEISIMQDMTSCRRFVEWLFGARGSIGKRALRLAIVRGLNPFCGHSFMAIARKSGGRR